MRASSLILATRQPVDESQVRALAGVHDLEVLDEQNHRYQVYHNRDSNPAEAIAQLVVEKGWGLLELSPVRHSIEEVFVDITQQEAA